MKKLSSLLVLLFFFLVGCQREEYVPVEETNFWQDDIQGEESIRFDVNQNYHNNYRCGNLDIRNTQGGIYINMSGNVYEYELETNSLNCVFQGSEIMFEDAEKYYFKRKISYIDNMPYNLFCVQKRQAQEVLGNAEADVVSLCEEGKVTPILYGRDITFTQDRIVYITDEKRLRTVDHQGENMIEIAGVPDSTWDLDYYIAGDKILYTIPNTEINAYEVRIASLDGLNDKTVSSERWASCWYEDGRVYFIQVAGFSVYDIDTDEVRVISDFSGYVPNTRLAYKDGWLYYIFDNCVYAISEDGVENRVIFDGNQQAGIYDLYEWEIAFLDEWLVFVDNAYEPQETYYMLNIETGEWQRFGSGVRESGQEEAEQVDNMEIGDAEVPYSQKVGIKSVLERMLYCSEFDYQKQPYGEFLYYLLLYDGFNLTEEEGLNFEYIVSEDEVDPMRLYANQYSYQRIGKVAFDQYIENHYGLKPQQGDGQIIYQAGEQVCIYQKGDYYYHYGDFVGSETWMEIESISDLGNGNYLAVYDVFEYDYATEARLYEQVYKYNGTREAVIGLSEEGMQWRLYSIEDKGVLPNRQGAKYLNINPLEVADGEWIVLSGELQVSNEMYADGTTYEAAVLMLDESIKMVDIEGQTIEVTEVGIAGGMEGVPPIDAKQYGTRVVFSGLEVAAHTQYHWSDMMLTESTIYRFVY